MLDSVAKDLEVRGSITPTNLVELPCVPLTTDNQKRPSNIRINELLAEVLYNQAQHQDVVDVSKQSDRSDSLNMGDTQRRRATQELLAEGSNSQHKANGAAKPTNQKMKSEENEVDQMESRSLEKIKVHPSSNLCQKLKNGTE